MRETVFVVCCCKDGEDPIINVYDNEDAATKYYNFALTNGKYSKVIMDEYPVCETFALFYFPSINERRTYYKENNHEQEEIRDYCEHWEPTYNSEDGRM